MLIGWTTKPNKMTDIERKCRDALQASEFETAQELMNLGELWEIKVWVVVLEMGKWSIQQYYVSFNKNYPGWANFTGIPDYAGRSSGFYSWRNYEMIFPWMNTETHAIIPAFMAQTAEQAITFAKQKIHEAMTAYANKLCDEIDKAAWTGMRN